MRTSVLFLGTLLLAGPVAAQTPLITLAPPPPPIFGAKTLVPAIVACTDLPVTAEPAPPTLHIIAPHSGDYRELSWRDQIVVLNAGTPEGVLAGQRFFARRFLPPRSTERTSEKFPAAIRTTGWLTVVAADEHSALARIDYACTGVASGDYLEPFTETTLPDTVAADGRTDFSNLGRVLQGVERHEAFGAGDLLNINRGSAQGISPGMRIAFYRDRRNGTPLVELGGGIVVEVTANTAKVVLDRARMDVTTDDYFAVRLTP